MEEITRKQKAYNLFKEGYNCCQSVVLAFEDILPLDRKQLLGYRAVLEGASVGRETCAERLAHTQ